MNDVTERAASHPAYKGDFQIWGPRFFTASILLVSGAQRGENVGLAEGLGSVARS